jgi:hypothetical protein
VFHLIVDDLIELNGRSPVIVGYRSIMKLCHVAHITQLVIPITLYSKESATPINSEIQAKRAEVLLKQTKGVFTELARNSRIERVPRQIGFLIPSQPTQKEVYQQTHQHLSFIFRTI